MEQEIIIVGEKMANLLHAVFSQARMGKRLLIGDILLKGENCRKKVDWLMACHGFRDKNGNFDWLLGYLPYADANGEVLHGFTAALSAKDIPIIAGIWATDPFRECSQLLKALKFHGYAGVCNYPCVGLLDGSFRIIAEQNGFGFRYEAEMMAMARSMDMFTMAIVFSIEEAEAMLAAGVDALIFHPGLDFIESPILHLDKYLEDISKFSMRITSNVYIFACCIAPGLLESMACSLLNINGIFLPRT